MKNINYFIQFCLIVFLFFLFMILGLKNSQKVSANIFALLGPIFRSKKICKNNLSKAFPLMTDAEKEKIIKKMWINYGKIFSEYPFIKYFRKSETNKMITIENQNYLENIKLSKNPVIFISGHFNNFELMAMILEKSGINLAAIYRPLNNKFLNPIMERIRKKYICRNQVKKGMSGTRGILKYFKNGSSIAIMIDQRVSQGVKTDFFGHEALTTTIPAQFVKKFNAKIVPVYIERIQDNSFKLKIHEEIKFDNNENVFSITLKLNKILEKMILKNPDQWIWTHNRWK